jgi:hypothetical protein
LVTKNVKDAPVVALLIGFALFWFSDSAADPDLWGHVRFGQDIVRTGLVRQQDVYSYRTAGQLWINHEWLSEVIFACIYDARGPAGLIVLKALTSLLILALSYAHLRRRGLEAYPSALLLMLVSVPYHLGLNTVRPQLFTYLLFLLLLLVLEGTRADLSWRVGLIPAIIAAWVNLHGGFMAGAGVLGLWGAFRAVAWVRNPARRLAELAILGLLGLGCGLAMCLNPYGYALLDFLLRTATVPRPEISEWTPMVLTSLPGALFLGLLALGIAGLAASRRPRRPEAIAVLSITAALTMQANRHYPLFALALIVGAGEHLADALRRVRPARPSTPGRTRAVLALLAGILFAVSSRAHWTCIRIDPFYFPYPARAVDFLARSRVHANLAVPFTWGEYVLWHLGPRVKVSIDGRRETVYSEETYQQTLDFQRGTGAWDALLESSATDLVLAPQGSPTSNLMVGRKGWVAVRQDSFCVLFAREGFPGLERFLETPESRLPPDGAGLCFPNSRRQRRWGTDRSTALVKSSQ